ncbi:MAG: septal ring lytic transglycosylase RlpA family protein [Pseudolabrys sp.]|nr:septal ring lytic transglycosylase RlpA family protein [Pseudolabrys sp.]
MRVIGRALVVAVAIAATTTMATAASKQTLIGKASFYDRNYRGRTASGSAYDGAKLTCAHRTLPFGTKLKVSDKRSGRSVVVIVNDRGPFVRGRVLDLSYAAARELRMVGRGVIQVRAEPL